ncbi:MAG: CPBP family intramembrane metalloprotease [Tissierellia bacterium]|nr:CPBP family intramembrane metalloprotease [Tissierellia bacterium]
MNLLMHELISSISQIVLFVIIPFIWWFLTQRTQVAFHTWIGLKPVKKENRKGAIKNSVIILILFCILSIILLFSLKGIETATSEFHGKGILALPVVFVYAIFNTSFPEELLFRGFLLKRLSNKFGFEIGNIIQSLLFGVIHGIIFFSVAGGIKTIIVTLFTGAVGYLMGYINEKKSNGSILPSWIIHGLANLFSSTIVLFSLI